MKQVFRYLLMTNPTGLASFTTVWAVGGIFWLATLAGLMSPVDSWILLKGLGMLSIFSLCLFLPWNFLFGTKY